MDINEIETSMKSALMERSKIRSCFINKSTGNLFSYNNKMYLITCRHVADEVDSFYTRDDFELIEDFNQIGIDTTSFFIFGN